MSKDSELNPKSKLNAEIEYFEKPGEKWKLWALREGTREEIAYSVEGLLHELREEFPSAQARAVLENGHIIKVRYKKKKSKDVVKGGPKKEPKIPARSEHDHCAEDEETFL